MPYGIQLFVLASMLVVSIALSISVAVKMARLKTNKFNVNAYISMTILTMSMALVFCLTFSENRTARLFIAILAFGLLLEYAIHSTFVIKKLDVDVSLKKICIANTVLTCFLLFSIFVAEFLALRGENQTINPVEQSQTINPVEQSQTINLTDPTTKTKLIGIFSTLESFLCNDEAIMQMNIIQLKKFIEVSHIPDDFDTISRASLQRMRVKEKKIDCKRNLNLVYQDLNEIEFLTAIGKFKKALQENKLQEILSTFVEVESKLSQTAVESQEKNRSFFENILTPFLKT